MQLRLAKLVHAFKTPNDIFAFKEMYGIQPNGKKIKVDSVATCEELNKTALELGPSYSDWQPGDEYIGVVEILISDDIEELKELQNTYGGVLTGDMLNWDKE